MQQAVVLIEQQLQPLKLLGEQPVQVVLHQLQKALESQLLVFEVQQQKSYYIVHALAVAGLRVVVGVAPKQVL